MSAPIGLTVKTKLEDMTIGDCIPCRYKATSGVAGTFSELGTCVATEIPYAGSATPDGLFYFIKTDTGMLIADRVIQHSISWDALNTAKYIQGNFRYKANIVIQNSIAGTRYSDFGVADSFFNNIGSVAEGPKSGSEYLYDIGFILPQAIKFKTFRFDYLYNLTSGFHFAQNRHVVIYGSNDATTLKNGTWDKIATAPTSIVNSYYFSCLNDIAYKAYKFTVSSCVVISGSSSTDQWILSKVGAYEEEGQVLLRSLTGGNAYLGTDGKANLISNEGLGAFPVNNEWDTFIVKSTLNNKITAGNDSVWHWNGLYSWCQDTKIDAVTRYLRGKTSAIRCDWAGSTYIANDGGFRPVLEYLETNSKATTLWY